MEDKKSDKLQVQMDWVREVKAKYDASPPSTILREIERVRDLDYLEAILYYGFQPFSMSALHAVMEMGRENKTDRIVNMLIYTLEHDKNPRVRGAVARCLGELASQQAVEPLIGALSDMGRHTASHLSTVRETMAEVLGQIGDKRALEPLLRCMEPDVMPSTKDEIYTEIMFQIKAAAAVGMLSDPRGIKFLLGLLKHNKFDIRDVASTKLRNLVREKANPMVWEDLSWLKSALIEGFMDNDKRVRKFAAMALGIIGDPTTAGDLTEALNDVDGGVRRAAKKSLKKMGKKI